MSFLEVLHFIFCKNHKFWSKICSKFKSKPSFDTVFDTDYHVEEIDTQQKQFDFRRDTNSTACFKPWAKNYSNPIDFNETRPSLGEFLGSIGEFSIVTIII